MSVLHRETVRQIIAQAMVPSQRYANEDMKERELLTKHDWNDSVRERFTGDCARVVENLTELYFSNSPRNGVSIDSLILE